MIHIFHRWSNWEDVAEEDEASGIPMAAKVLLIRRRIRQKRRCSVCNLVETRAA